MMFLWLSNRENHLLHTIGIYIAPPHGPGSSFAPLGSVIAVQPVSFARPSNDDERKHEKYNKTYIKERT
jgi:hypothetical protein